MIPVKYGPDLAGHGGGHRLVEQREAVRDVAGVDHREPLRVDRHRGQLGVAHLAADPDGVLDPRERPLEVTGVQCNRRLEHREEPVLAARLECGDVPLSPHQEPAPHGGLVAHEVLDREAPGHPPRGRVVPLGVVGGVRLLADRERPRGASSTTTPRRRTPRGRRRSCSCDPRRGTRRRHRPSPGVPPPPGLVRSRSPASLPSGFVRRKRSDSGPFGVTPSRRSEVAGSRPGGPSPPPGTRTRPSGARPVDADRGSGDGRPRA